jgi:hypothetical protein
MKEIGTFMGGAGKYQATIYETIDGAGTTFYQVNYGLSDSEKAFKLFMTEYEATEFATKYTNVGNKPTFLSE